MQEALEGFKTGKVAFLFLAPEQFNHAEILSILKESKLSLFVVDEAHCISEWGHDFRPDYLRLGTIIEELEHPRVLALTATAALPVRTEILERLHMRDPRVIVRGIDRPNLWLGVETFQDEVVKQRTLLERVAHAEKPGIIYVATHKHAEEVAQALNQTAGKAGFYHADLSSKQREAVQAALKQGDIMVPLIHFPDRVFTTWKYTISHRQLILRSVKDKEQGVSTRIDILFKPVAWMSLPLASQI